MDFHSSEPVTAPRCRYIAIGDVHGSATQLSALLKEKDLFVDRRTVFTGDYVDVGPDPAAVIDRLIEYRRQKPDTIFLRGNHEIEMLRFRERGDFVRYAKLGGLSTLHSYLGEARGDVQIQFRQILSTCHLVFLNTLLDYYETDDYLFSHCGYNPDRPMDRSTGAMVMTSHQHLFTSAATLPKTAVCGHYFQRTLVPYVSEQVICLDSGCGILRGPLSAFLLPERILVQVDARDQVTLLKNFSATTS